MKDIKFRKTFSFLFGKLKLKALKILRNTDDVDSEFDDLLYESKNASSGDSENVSIIGLFRSVECRWAIITAIVLHVVQQFSGINAVIIANNPDIYFYYHHFNFEQLIQQKRYSTIRRPFSKTLASRTSSFSTPSYPLAWST